MTKTLSLVGTLALLAVGCNAESQAEPGEKKSGLSEEARKEVNAKLKDMYGNKGPGNPGYCDRLLSDAKMKNVVGAGFTLASAADPTTRAKAIACSWMTDPKQTTRKIAAVHVMVDCSPIATSMLSLLSKQHREDNFAKTPIGDSGFRYDDKKSIVYVSKVGTCVANVIGANVGGPQVESMIKHVVSAIATPAMQPK